MDLPIKPPSEAQVILRDVARFRALTPAERIRRIWSLLAGGRSLMSRSPKAARAREYAEERGRLAHRGIREVVARHARRNRSPSRRFAPADGSLAEAFDARSVRYALIGGLAFMLRGGPRYTEDLDFLIDVQRIVLPSPLDELVERGPSLDPTAVIQQYVREYVASFPFGGVRIDRLKPVLPLHSRTLAEASLSNGPGGHTVRVATAEGLIVTKMVAIRPRDQIDTEARLTANRDTIGVDHIRQDWTLFAASEPERTA